MEVPFVNIPLLEMDLREEILGAVSSVLASGSYILGSHVEEFEKKMAARYGVGHAVGVSSGTDALLLSLMAMGIDRNDLIVTTPYTFVATAEAIVRAGAVPVFVDVDKRTFNLDPGRLEEWLRAHPAAAARVKAVVPVHLFGQCAAMSDILAAADRYGIPVIEDAAQALGASFPLRDGTIRNAGTVGRCGCVSFFPTKNLGGIGDGGMIFTNDSALAGKIRSMRNHGIEKKGIYGAIGGNFRLDEIQAAVLMVKASHLEQWQRKRQENAAYYDSRLSRFLPETAVPPFFQWKRENHVYNQYVLRVDYGRDDLRRYLAERGIETEIYYPLPLHLQPFLSRLGVGRGSFPASEALSECSLALPVSPSLTRAQQDYVIQSIADFYE